MSEQSRGERDRVEMTRPGDGTFLVSQG